METQEGTPGPGGMPGPGDAAMAALVEAYKGLDRSLTGSSTCAAVAMQQEFLVLDNENLDRLGLKPGSSWRELETSLVAEADAKALYLVRHGEGNHNEAERRLGSKQWEEVEAKDAKYMDAALNSVGHEQCKALSVAVDEAALVGFEVDVILVSPLTRAIETAKHGLGSFWGKVPVIAVEMTRECFGKNTCDMRKPVAQLKLEFPEVNFDLFMESEDDTWWTPERETREHIHGRIANFYNFLLQTPPHWKRIAVVGHSEYQSQSVHILSGLFHWPANGELVPIVVKPKDAAVEA